MKDASTPVKVWITPVKHPQTIFKGQWNREPANEVYIQRLGEHVSGGPAPREWALDTPPNPRTTLNPTLSQLESWTNEVLNGPWDAVSHDIESAGPYLICDGMVPFNSQTGELGPAVCLRFRIRGGHSYWQSRADHDKAVALYSSVLSSPDHYFVGHNVVGYDVPVLESLGFVVGGPILDTMIMVNRAYSEFPKGLQWVSTLFLWAPVWKTLTDEEDDVDGKS